MFTLPLVYFPTSLINCPSWSFHLQIWEMVNVAHVVLFLNSHCYHWVHVGASSTDVLPADFSTHPRLSHPRWDTESVLSHFSAFPPAAGGHSFSSPLTTSIPRIVCHSIYWLGYCDYTHTCPCPGSCAPQHTCGSQRTGGGVASFPQCQSGSAQVVRLGAMLSDRLSQPTHPGPWILFHN